MESLENVLKKSGLSVTRPRVAIFKLLNSADVPMGIQELIKESPTIDRATIYRTVELFENLGVVKRVWFGFKSKVELSDEFQSHHHHIVCEDCGRIEKIDSANLERLISRVTKRHGYKPTSHHIEIFGECFDCAKKV